MVYTYQIEHNKRTLEIQILRTRRKNISFEINQERIAKLKVPMKMTNKAIINFCRENGEALIAQYDKAEKSLPFYVPKEIGYESIYYNNARLPFGDEEIELSIIKGGENGKNHIYYKEGADGKKKIVIESQVPDSPGAYRESAVIWFRQYARYELSKKAKKYGDIMGVTYGRITIKEQKTRWGSCSSKGNINFNWKLALMPEFMQEYIVVHELAHLKEMNHSKVFWEEVGKILPDYKQRIRWQKEHEREYEKY